LDRFEGVETQVLGLSVDSTDSLFAWAESLGGITYPLLSDFYPHGEVAQKYGVLRSDGKSQPAIFVIDNLGIIPNVDVHDIDQQPDNEELTSFAGLEPQAAAAGRRLPPRGCRAGHRSAPEADVLSHAVVSRPSTPRLISTVSTSVCRSTPRGLEAAGRVQP
jgi:hypothetical protein